MTKSSWIVLIAMALFIALSIQQCSCDQWFNNGCPWPWEEKQ